MAKAHDSDLDRHFQTTSKRFNTLVSPAMQHDRIKLSIMTTRSNQMGSPLYSSIGGPEEVNGGFTVNAAAATMKPHLYGKPNMPPGMDRNFAQRSEMVSTYDSKKGNQPL